MVGVMPEDARSGSYFFWSNKGDESDMTLTRDFDFSGISGPLTLKYWAWYDLEEDYDYVYVEVSEDGQNWTILKTPSGTDKDPSGNSYGWGYNGLSHGWIEESVDLSSYAGEKVQVRFEYVTDAAVNGEGFLLEDLSIPETGYNTDFLTDEGGWQGEGFVRIKNVLPQTFKVSLIEFGDSTTVETLTIKGGEPVQIPINIGGDVRYVVMTVSGTTRFTRQPALYKFSVIP
jgi:immune inhibitor A